MPVIFVLITLIFKLCTVLSQSDNYHCVKNGTEVKCDKFQSISDRTLSLAVQDLNAVTNIEISNQNEPTEVNGDTFTNMPNLITINIRKTKINKLFAKTVEDLPNLKYVYLNYNEITDIYVRAFVNLLNLRKIYLKHNNLKIIRKGIFQNVPNLENIALSSNEIQSIEDGAFFNIPNLKLLALDNNRLDAIFVHELVSYPDKLEILWLHNNSLTFVTNYMLQNLKNLNTLNLGFNRITVIENNSFQHTPNLKTLVLTHNHLKELNGDIFPRSGLDSLENVYLDNNKLMYLTSKVFVRLSVLKRITLMGNPWYCTCLKEIYKILMENQIQEKCHELFSNGKRPVCVNQNVIDDSCSYEYNTDLSDKFSSYMKKFPLFIPAIKCFL